MAKLPKIPPVEKKINIYDTEQIEKEKVIKLTKIETRKYTHGVFLKKHSTIRKVTFEQCIFSQNTIDQINFHDCNFIDCAFNGTIFDSCELHNCGFKNCVFYKSKFKDTYIDPRALKFDKRWYLKYANVNAGLFQELYKNSKNMHQEKFAMHADIKFLFYLRYDHLLGRKKSILKFLKGLLFDIVLGYGYGIANTIIITTIGISVFAILIEKSIIVPASEKIGILEAFYFSIVSFTTVGYGDLAPKKEFLSLTLTMGFLISSVVWCAIVTAIIVKRIVK